MRLASQASLAHVTASATIMTRVFQQPAMPGNPQVRCHSRRRKGGARGCQRKRGRAETGKLNNNHRIVTVSVRTSHIFICLPIVFPPHLIDEIAELIFSSGLEFERNRIISTLELSHGMRVDTPIVEIADNTDTLCIRCNDSWQSERHLTCLVLLQVLFDDARPGYGL